MAAVLIVPSAAAAGATAAGASVAHHAPAAALPKVSGGFGTKPTLTFPSTAAPKSLVVKVLHQGSGAVVRSGEMELVTAGGVRRLKVGDSFVMPRGVPHNGANPFGEAAQVSITLVVDKGAPARQSVPAP